MKVSSKIVGISVELVSVVFRNHHIRPRLVTVAVSKEVTQWHQSARHQYLSFYGKKTFRYFTPWYCLIYWCVMLAPSSRKIRKNSFIIHSWNVTQLCLTKLRNYTRTEEPCHLRVHLHQAKLNQKAKCEFAWKMYFIMNFASVPWMMKSKLFYREFAFGCAFV